eukprot:9466260-Pyramimonas_sp.AAC.1
MTSGLTVENFGGIALKLIRTVTHQDIPHTPDCNTMLQPASTHTHTESARVSLPGLVHDMSDDSCSYPASPCISDAIVADHFRVGRDEPLPPPNGRRECRDLLPLPIAFTVLAAPHMSQGLC